MTKGKVPSAAVVLALLAGCASSQLVSDTGRTLTYQHDHDQAALMETYRDAAANCKAKGLIARQTSTVCPDRCQTKFECIQR
ncbi:MAG: hypothetical protein U1E66_13920 [Rhodospirillales bacterium]